jgi:hypothetical protein
MSSTPAMARPVIWKEMILAIFGLSQLYFN